MRATKEAVDFALALVDNVMGREAKVFVVPPTRETLSAYIAAINLIQDGIVGLERRQLTFFTHILNECVRKTS